MSEPPAYRFSKRAQKTVAQPIGELMAMGVERDDLISLAAGLVDYPTLPSEEVALIATDILQASGRDGRVPLQYGTTEGHAALRQRLLEHLAGLDGLAPSAYGANASDVVISSGSQQLLFLLTDVLVDPGDIVITARPSYFVYTGALAGFGAEVRTVDIDDQGMDPVALGALLAELESREKLDQVKIVYVQPDHQNPTGLSLAESRRGEIAEIVQRYSYNHRILLIEDAAYRELTYDGSVARSIKSHDANNQFVALLQTFSKPFSPGLRTGYGLLPSDLVEAVLHQKGGHDFGSSNFSQHLILEAMKRGVYQKQVQKLRSHYGHKARAVADSLQNELGDQSGVHWTTPTGGLYVWVSLPTHIDTGPDGPLWSKALDVGTAYVPGAYCYPKDPTRDVPTHQMRLAFGTVEPEQIPEAIRRLAFAIRPLL